MDIFDWIKKLIGDRYEPTFFEIGAHYAEDSGHIMSLLQEPEYFAVECDPRNIEFIKKTAVYQEDGFCLAPYAISDVSGTVTLYQSSGNANPGHSDWTGSSSILKPKNHLNAHEWCKFDNVIEVPSISLDDLMYDLGLGKIDMIWADIQGAETKMIKGGQKTLSNTDFLYCEHDSNELYEGQKPLEEWMSLLPGKWEILEKFPHDVLLKRCI